MTAKITLYGTPTCPQVPSVRGMLNRAAAPYEYVNIAQDAAGLATVRQINGGNASVPTLVFPDGSTLTEPGNRELATRLTELGHPPPAATPLQSLMENPFYTLMGAGALIFGLIDGNPVFLIIGLGFLGFVLLKDRIA